jgi:hypothetical protein
MLHSIKKKDAWVLTGMYILFFFGLVFSRYSSSSIFNGENFISKFFYYGTALLLIGSLVYYYIKYYKEGDKGFELIDYEYLLLFSLFMLCLFTARSAVRLIMVLGPIAPIFLAFLVVFTVSKFRKSKEETSKLFFGILAIILIVLSIFIFWNFYTTVKAQSYGYVPSYYNQQWQKAMDWVRTETPTNAVFAHWWDYGYWVQSIGQRATVLDGGNSISYWNYLIGRYVLTGDNQKDALEFLYSHNATNLLIDSSDLGKYGAFSIIGSDQSLDRFSPGPPSFVSDSSQIQEKADGTLRVYRGGSYIDEDISYNLNGTQISLFSGKAAVIGILLQSSNETNNSLIFNQPQGVFYDGNNQISIPLRYLYFQGKLIDFGSGLKATVYVMPSISQTSNGQVQIDNVGAAMYISPRLMRGMLAQVYILNDPFNNFPNFKIAHVEQNMIISNLNQQGLNLGEFVYFGDIQGPIKIWNIKYTGNEKVNPAYIDTDYTKYISWKL